MGAGRHVKNPAFFGLNHRVPVSLDKDLVYRPDKILDLVVANA